MLLLFHCESADIVFLPSISMDSFVLDVELSLCKDDSNLIPCYLFEATLQEACFLF